ncbi:MAG: hypothetical protein FWB98_00495 [Defluviitaleaceae bacterium]|nr:hypothetical protein [Defluviitaleaceae bacterium]
MFREKKQKVGVFNRFLDFINKLYPVKRRESGDEKPSSFSKFVEQEGRRENIVNAAMLCDEALNIVSDRIVLINRLRDVEERMEGVAAYGRLSKEDVEDLKDLLDRYMNMSRESNALKYQVTDFDAGLSDLGKLQEDAQNSVPEIKFAEERQRMFKKDIGYLEGEKMVLEHARERLTNAGDFLYKLAIATVLFFAAACLVLVFLYAVHQINTILILAGMLVFIIVIAGLLYSLRQKLRYELRMNAKKQSRAITLLNKKIANYAHFTNYLNYKYRKYKVRNSQMLENNLEDYNNYKFLTKRLDSLRDIMSQTEGAIDFFLKDKGMDRNYSSIEKFASTLNIDDKLTFHSDLTKEKALIESSLKRLDTRSAQIWDVLTSMKSSPGKDALVITEMVDEYVAKAGKLIETDEKFGTTAMLTDEELFLPEETAV